MSVNNHFDPKVVSEIRDAIGRVGDRPFVVAIDGPGGSGKSTLAREIVSGYAGRAAIPEGMTSMRTWTTSTVHASTPGAATPNTSTGSVYVTRFSLHRAGGR